MSDQIIAEILEWLQETNTTEDFETKEDEVETDEPEAEVQANNIGGWVPWRSIRLDKKGG